MLNKINRFLDIHGKETAEVGSDGLPLPSRALRTAVAGTDDAEWFIEGGRLGAAAIVDILQRHGQDIGSMEAIADFGCGCGRVLRHWQEFSHTEVHGSDYNPELIRWCRQNLTFARFQTNKLEPPLCYADDRFDLVYALSVFTHMPEALQFAWMQELTRIIRPGGYLLITTHGEYYSDQLSDSEREQFRAGQLVVRKPKRAGANACAAFHPEIYIREKLFAGLTLIDFIPEGAKGNPRQDASLLQKPGT